MTLEEWERCDDPRKMLEFLGSKASGRKLRLFACACCRGAPYLLTGRYARAVEVAERYADGLASREELRAATDADWWVFRATQPTTTYDTSDASRAASRAANMLADTTFPEARFDGQVYLAAARLRSGEANAQAGLVRCVVGNPFRPPPVIPPAVLAYRGGAIKRLGEAIYAARRFEDLPVLADLLEEAGCCDAALLGHLRGPGPRVLGCHALDAVLGKG
jgi:hypothetical protein